MILNHRSAESQNSRIFLAAHSGCVNVTHAKHGILQLLPTNADLHFCPNVNDRLATFEPSIGRSPLVSALISATRLAFGFCLARLVPGFPRFRTALMSGSWLACST